MNTSGAKAFTLLTQIKKYKYIIRKNTTTTIIIILNSIVKTNFTICKVLQFLASFLILINLSTNLSIIIIELFLSFLLRIILISNLLKYKYKHIQTQFQDQAKNILYEKYINLYIQNRKICKEVLSLFNIVIKIFISCKFICYTQNTEIFISSANLLSILIQKPPFQYSPYQ
ncbi:hypothetical protein ABPG72_019680 [Tetrahymena utriculariae]